MVNEGKRWIYEEIQAMIDQGREESLTLDYKASEALFNNKEIAKDVSAFANSDGGMIIYGVEEEGHKPIRVDEGVHPTKKSKEAIENTILDSIQPRISGIRIHPIDLPTGNQLFIVEIPKSNNAPHMSQNKYYKRYNFQSVPMEHYEILDVMNRQSGPDLWLEVAIWNEQQLISTKSIDFQLEMALKNDSKNSAQDIIITLAVDTRLNITVETEQTNWNAGSNSDKETPLSLSTGENFSVKKYSFSYSPSIAPIFTPIFGKGTFGFRKYTSINPDRKKHEFRFNKDHYRRKKFDTWNAYIHWQIEAPNMTSRFGLEKITTGQAYRSSNFSDDNAYFPITIQNIERGLL